MNKNYQFKTPSLYKGLSADDAMQELERIREKHGTLLPEFVVDESRDENALLHNYFQWDDTLAAQQYREKQARNLMQNITVVVKRTNVEVSFRAIVNVRKEKFEPRSYIPIQEAFDNEVAYADLLKQAKADMESFVEKYQTLSELDKVRELMVQEIAKM